MKNRWDDNNLHRDGCFAWLHHWKMAPTHTVAGFQELYQQLLPTKVYYHRRTGMSGNADERCRMCGKTSERVGHILGGSSAIAQTQYLARQNKALKILFSEMLRSLNLISTTAPWYSQAQPKPMYENDRVIAYWDVHCLRMQPMPRPTGLTGGSLKRRERKSSYLKRAVRG